jgi:hypothetical protein
MAAVLIAGLAALALQQSVVPAQAASMPALDHFFVIVMENEGYGSIVGSSAAPYINSLTRAGGLGASYYAVAHPSLPNYLAMTGGSTFGITTDCTTCWVSAPNVADSLESAGKTWKAYEESMPSACFVGDSYPYAQKHDPFIYYNDIRTNTSRCQSHVVPYSQLSSDLTFASTTPNFGFITPNLCDDMHDCAIATGDSWLANNVPHILASPAFTAQRSALAIVWDEGNTSSNQVPLILLGSAVSPGFTSTVVANHYSLLRTVEAGFGLPTLTASDASASPMSDYFSLIGWSNIVGIATSSPAVSSWGTARLDVFVRGTDMALWHRSWNGTAWGGWESLGGVVTSDPAAVSQGANSIDVFVRGTDRAIWHRSWNGTSWAPWESLGGVAISSPAASSWGPGRLDLVVDGTDYAVWHRSWNGTAWSAWDSVGGYATTDPGVASTGAGVVDAFVRGTDDALWFRSGNGTGTWSAWSSLGGILTSGPAATSCVAGHLDVFATGTDGGIWQRGFNGASWAGWIGLHGLWTIGPSAVCPAGGASVDLGERAPNFSVVYSSTPGT